MNVKALAGSLMLASLALTSFSAQAAWYVSDITIPGYFTSPSDINDAGQIAGRFVTGNASMGFLYEKGTVNALTDVIDLQYIQQINASGQIAGSTWSNGSFIYDKGQITNLPNTASSRIQALAINDLGQVSGLGNGPSAALYSNGTSTNIGGLDFAVASWGWGINNAGTVTGVSFGGGKAGSWVYENGKITELTSPGATDIEAYRINNAGQIIGSSKIGEDRHAFLYDKGTFTDIGALVGTTDNSAIDINDKGQVIGHSIVGNQSRSFLYNNGSITDLSALPELISKGWSNIQAIAINNLGEIIGAAVSGSDFKAFVLSPNRQFDTPTGVAQFAAPEIDGGNAMLGIALLGGFMSLLRRKKSQQS